LTRPDDVPEEVWLMATDVMHEHTAKTWARNLAEHEAHILIGAYSILAERNRVLTDAASFTEALKSVPARDLKTGRDALVEEGWKLLRALGVEPS
jgi:hypothetical protein